VVARTKNLLAAAKELQRRYGDSTISEAIEKLTNPRSGRPTQWHEIALMEVYGGVEALRTTGLGVTAACRGYAQFAKIGPKIVEKRYAEAKRRLPILFPSRAEMMIWVRVVLSFRPALQRFLIESGAPPRSTGKVRSYPNRGNIRMFGRYVRE
jgi:hypothetical protein